MKPVVIPMLLCALMGTNRQACADGALDPNYGIGGRVTAAFDKGAGNTDQAFGAALQADGRLVVVGSATVDGHGQDFAIMRFLRSGEPDASFGAAGQVLIPIDFVPGGNDVARAVAIQPDGKIVVAGTADGYSGISAGESGSSMVLLRLLTDGSLDSEFGQNYTHIESFTYLNTYGGATSVALFDGVIVMAGYLNPIGSAIGPTFVLYDADGHRDAAILYPGYGPGSTATSTRFDAAGRMTLAGYYASSGTDGFDCFVSRFAAGSFASDWSFGNNGTFTFRPLGDGMQDFCFAHALDAHGNIVVVGESVDPIGDGSRVTMTWLDSNGHMAPFPGHGDDFQFEDGSVGARNSGRAVQIDSKGRVLIAGYGHVSDATRAPYDFGVLRVATVYLGNTGDDTLIGQIADGTFAGSEPGSAPGRAMIGFETTTSGRDDGAFALALDGQNRAYVVGQHQSGGSDYDMAVARLQSDLLFLGDFDP